MLDFVKSYYKENKNLWYVDYINFLMKENNKIITVNNSNIETLHIIFSLFLCYNIYNNKILFVSDNPEKIYQLISLFLRNFDENTYNRFTSKYMFFNGSEIDILDINVITNNTIHANYVFVELNEFDTKISEYIVLSNLQSKLKDFFMLCSIKDYKNSYFFKDLIENPELSLIPVVET